MASSLTIDHIYIHAFIHLIIIIIFLILSSVFHFRFSFPVSVPVALSSIYLSSILFYPSHRRPIVLPLDTTTSLLPLPPRLPLCPRPFCCSSSSLFYAQNPLPRTRMCVSLVPSVVSRHIISTVCSLSVFNYHRFFCCIIAIIHRDRVCCGLRGIQVQ